MASLRDIERVHAIMRTFDAKRRNYFAANPGHTEYDLPAALGRSCEALVIVKLLRENKDWTGEMIGHHA